MTCPATRAAGFEPRAPYIVPSWPLPFGCLGAERAPAGLLGGFLLGRQAAAHAVVVFHGALEREDRFLGPVWWPVNWDQASAAGVDGSQVDHQARLPVRGGSDAFLFHTVIRAASVKPPRSFRFRPAGKSDRRGGYLGIGAGGRRCSLLALAARPLQGGLGASGEAGPTRGRSGNARRTHCRRCKKWAAERTGEAVPAKPPRRAARRGACFGLGVTWGVVGPAGDGRGCGGVAGFVLTTSRYGTHVIFDSIPASIVAYECCKIEQRDS